MLENKEREIKAGEFLFIVDNGGLLVEVEGKQRKLNPSQTKKLFQLLDGHIDEISNAVR